MQLRKLGTQGLEGLGSGPRVHGDVGVLRSRRRHRVDRHHPPGPGAGRHASSTPPTCTARSGTSACVGRALAGRRGRVVLATKFGNQRREDGSWVGINGRPEYVHEACEASLRAAWAWTTSTSTISTASTVPCPSKRRSAPWPSWSREGKVRYLGLSEASPETIRRAHAVHPITALQTEYSLWARQPEARILPTVRELGIGFVAYSPLGRGFLTGRFRSHDGSAGRRDGLSPPPAPLPDREPGPQPRACWSKLESDRRREGRHAGTAGAGLGAASGAPDIVPIPGTKRRRYLEENVAAAEIELTRRRAGDASTRLRRPARRPATVTPTCRTSNV